MPGRSRRLTIVNMQFGVDAKNVIEPEAEVSPVDQAAVEVSLRVNRRLKIKKQAAVEVSDEGMSPPKKQCLQKRPSSENTNEIMNDLFGLEHSGWCDHSHLLTAHYLSAEFERHAKNINEIVNDLFGIEQTSIGAHAKSVIEPDAEVSPDAENDIEPDPPTTPFCLFCDNATFPSPICLTCRATMPELQAPFTTSTCVFCDSHILDDHICETCRATVDVVTTLHLGYQATMQDIQ